MYPLLHPFFTLHPSPPSCLARPLAQRSGKFGGDAQPVEVAALAAPRDGRDLERRHFPRAASARPSRPLQYGRSITLYLRL